MGYSEWLVDYLNELRTSVRAKKAQRRKGRSRQFCFAPLRLCGNMIALILLTSLWTTLTAQSRRPMTPPDIMRLATVSDAQISPSGEWVAYTVSTTDGDTTRSTLWLVRASLEGRPPIRRPPSSPNPELDQIRQPANRLLPPNWTGSNPRWSPDSKGIAFLGEHDGTSGIWVVSLERRQPRLLATIQNTNFFITYAGEQFSWSPDGKLIAFVSATEESSDIAEVGGKKDDPRVIDRIQYKSRTSFSDRLRTHIFLVYVDNGETRQLTSGAYYDHAVAFSPRGDEIAFLSNHETDPDANNNSDIFAVDLHAQVRQITNTKGCEYEPAWSPDGKWIAYAATKRDVTTIDSVAEDSHIWIITSAGNNARELSASYDYRARTPRWSADSKTVFFLANNRGLTRIHSLSPSCSGDNCLGTFPSSQSPLVKNDTANYEPLGFPNVFQISSYSLTPSDSPTFAFTSSDPKQPYELWLGVFGRREFIRRLTGHNDAFIRSAEINEPESFTFRSVDGTPVQAWLIKPSGWRADRKYPLILSIHGGPHGMFGWALNPTFQVYAGRGYAVLYLNPRGSNGYGQKFSDGTLNEWGGGDYRDLMAGVDEAIKRWDWIDADRMGVTGGSYGGFMTNWVITQTPRFKAAVSVASLSNLISFYSTSLYQDLIHAEFGGAPWDNYDLLWQWSPLRYAKQVQTPALFIHGEQDNDVHITQAEEMYMALKRRGIDTVLVRYPREGHGLREPRHRVDALERTLAWFDRYLK